LLEQTEILLQTIKKTEIELQYSHLNADAGFDIQKFIQLIEEKHQIIANIPKNKRNTKKLAQEYRYLSEYIRLP
jgi:predicted RNA-binding protein with EMAP domain